jgi:penicillin-binding protein 2
MAAGALQEGVITPYTYLDCPAAIYIRNQYNPAIVYSFDNWAGFDRGGMEVTEALSQSCDTFFYQVGQRLGPTRQAKWATAFGYGAPSGLETAAAESAGLIPTPEWKQKTIGDPWFDGDTLHDAIGQGFVLVTPMQQLAAYAAIANGGTLLKPQIVAEVDSAGGKPVETLQPQVVRQVGVDPALLALVRRGLWKVTHSGTGTATFYLGSDANDIAGKTGTAEFGAVFGGRYVHNHAWFVGYAPASSPEIAITVLIENGGNDREHGMHLPIVKQVIDYYFAHRDAIRAGVTTPGVLASAPPRVRESADLALLCRREDPA